MKKKILIVLLVLIFLYCIGGVIYSVLIDQKDNTVKVTTSLIKIDGYDYFIDEERESSLYINEFKTLKGNLENTNVNIDEYVKSIAKLYIIDLYSLNSKNNKYDVTATQYVNEEISDNFKLKVSETIYKYIEDNSDNLRKQELPQVSEVVIKNVETVSYLLNDVEISAYKVNVEWLYEKDLGYDTSANLILINDNDIVSVLEESRVEDVELSLQDESN